MNLMRFCTLILILFFVFSGCSSPLKVEQEVHKLEKERNKLIEQIEEARYELGQLKIEDKYDRSFLEKMFGPSQEGLEKEIKKLVRLKSEVSEKLSHANGTLNKENSGSGTGIMIFLILVFAFAFAFAFIFIISKIEREISPPKNDQTNNPTDDFENNAYGAGDFSPHEINQFNSWRENPNTDTLIYWSSKITKYLIGQSGIKFEGRRPDGIINFFNETNYYLPKALTKKLKDLQSIRNQRTHGNIKVEEIPKNYQDKAEKAWLELVKHFSK